MAYGHTAKKTDYEKYKASLHAIFEGKAPLPGRIRQMMDENQDTQEPPVAPISSEPCVQKEEKKPRRYSPGNNLQYKTLLQAIMQAEQNNLVAKLDDFLAAGFELPKDEEVLSKALMHPSQDVLVKILHQLQSYLQEQASKHPRLLKMRLENAKLMTSCPSLREQCEDVAKLLS